MYKDLFLISKEKIKLLLISFILFIFLPKAFSQENPFVAPSRIQIVDHKMYIYYYLSGSYKNKYNISLSIKKHTEPDFNYTPMYIYGDLGSMISIGLKCIIWEFEKEFPLGLDMVNYYFVIKVFDENSPRHTKGIVMNISEKSTNSDEEVSDNIRTPKNPKYGIYIGEYDTKNEALSVRDEFLKDGYNAIIIAKDVSIIGTNSPGVASDRNNYSRKDEFIVSDDSRRNKNTKENYQNEEPGNENQDTRKVNDESQSAKQKKMENYQYKGIKYSYSFSLLPLYTKEMQDVHVSDWENYGTGTMEGRVLLPLSKCNINGSYAIKIEAEDYWDNHPFSYLAELEIKPGALLYIGLLLGIEYRFVDTKSFSIGIIPKVGYGVLYADFGTVEMLPGKTQPVITPSGTFYVGDQLSAHLSGFLTQLDLNFNIPLSKKIIMNLQVGYSSAFFGDPKITASAPKSEEENNGSNFQIDFSNPAVVQPIFNSIEPAGINPKASINGWIISLGFSYGF